MSSRRIPPPPTRYAPRHSQARQAPNAARGMFAPPPVHGAGTVQRMPVSAAPPPAATAQKPASGPRPPRAAQRKLAPLARRGAAVIQRAVLDKPVKLRPVVECTMGQGVKGRLDLVILFSRRFSSCTPVVMFNDYTFNGGLFHFSAGRLDLQHKWLSDLFNNVSPTIVYIGKRELKSTLGGAFDRVATETTDDFKEIGKFLRNKGYDGEIKELGGAQQYYVWVDSADQLKITFDLPKGTGETIDFTYTKTPAIAESDRDAMTSVSLFGQNLYPDGKPV